MLAIVLGGGLVRLVFGVNAIKELNLDEPLLPSDLMLERQVLNHMGFFAHYTSHRLVLPGLVAPVFVAVLWATWRLECR